MKASQMEASKMNLTTQTKSINKLMHIVDQKEEEVPRTLTTKTLSSKSSFMSFRNLEN